MILLLRHGQTAYNAEHRLQGHLDAPLTDLGRDQAARMGALVARLVAGRDAVIHASPLGRAMATAQIVAATLDAPPPIRTDDGLKEISVGAWEGRTVAEIDEAHPGIRLLHPPGHWLFHAPGGETLEGLKARTAAALARIKVAEGPAIRVIVAHGVANWALRMAHTGLGPDLTFISGLPQDAVMELAPDGRVIRLDDAP